MHGHKMETLETNEEIDQRLSNMKVLDEPDFKQTGYNMLYPCGCGNSHPLDGSDGSRVILQERTVSPLSVLIVCENSYVTNVHQKGIFRPKCSSVWSTSSRVFFETLIQKHNYAFQKLSE